MAFFEVSAGDVADFRMGGDTNGNGVCTASSMDNGSWGTLSASLLV